MPRKTKDDELKTETVTGKKTSAKRSTTTKKTTEKKAATTKSISTKKAKTSSAKKTESKAKPVTKKVPTKKEPVKKTAAKKTTTTKKSRTSKKATTKKTTTTKKTSTTKTTTPKMSFTPPVLEYYDLPYRYNQTIVKVLAQNPHTLFVYWDISDNDREAFIKNYGANFFNNTKPVLVVNNLTDNYTYEVEINDFANNWYINVDDAKCEYSITLGRRKREYVQDTKYDYLDVAYSNAIEIPNDRILYFKENDKIHFKNIKTNKVTTKIFKNHIYWNSIHEIYKNYNIPENQDKMDIKNPSSDFLSSNVL